MHYLHQMFSVSCLLLDDALKPATPVTNGAISETWSLVSVVAAWVRLRSRLLHCCWHVATERENMAYKNSARSQRCLWILLRDRSWKEVNVENVVISTTRDNEFVLNSLSESRVVLSLNLTRYVNTNPMFLRTVVGKWFQMTLETALICSRLACSPRRHTLVSI